MLVTLEINGFRGFEEPQTIEFAKPNNQPGSGLTIIVGPNNGGKSTVIEALNVLASRMAASFTEGRRNKKSGDRIRLKLQLSNGQIYKLQTVDYGGSETSWGSNTIPDDPQIVVLPSRRYFNPYFTRGTTDRFTYSRRSLPDLRGQESHDFSFRLFTALNNREKFNNLLEKVINPLPNWTIDQADNGQYYLKFEYNGQFHNSDGMGEGLVSLFFIIDALYDSKKGEVIVIDEPELSLHPSLQERLSELLSQFSANRQIIYATHSPEFISYEAIFSGAKVARVCKQSGMSKIFQVSDKTISLLKQFKNNTNNPHILGLDARKAFFLDEGVILFEGQEDVVYFKKALSLLNETIFGSIYGWGVGGASNMKVISSMLRDLGFKRVVGILDKNVSDIVSSLKSEFSEYIYLQIPANDMRTKPAVKAKDRVEGLFNSDGNLIEKYIQPITDIVTTANVYINDSHK